jgi:peptidoglycan/LPS O-acetylase OafA/YrhL
MFLSDLQNHQPAIDWANNRRWTRRILAPFLLFIGLYLASYPEEHPEYTRWSHWLYVLATWILPERNDKARFMTGIGLQVIAMGIHFSPKLKDLLSNKYFLWLGKNSFAVYLIHGMLLRWWLVWAVYGVTLPVDTKDENGQVRAGEKLHLKSWPHLVFWIPIWFVAMYACANLWTRYVDPMCARWTVAIEKYVWKDMSVNVLPATTKRDDGQQMTKREDTVHLAPLSGMMNGTNGQVVEPKRP